MDSGRRLDGEDLRPAEVVVQTMTLRSRPDQRLALPPGLHLVIQARSCGPGQPYIGGDGVHLAGNEGEVPVDMGVTYLIAPGQSMAVSRVPHQAPTACPVL